MKKRTKMVTFTRRTNFPKLGWLMEELTKKHIPHKIAGESFHAPILLVDKLREDEAWAILEPVDDIRDDDPQFAVISRSTFEVLTSGDLEWLEWKKKMAAIGRKTP